MKATFSAREPNILMEAQPGDLFVPLGPKLVDCVCAVRTIGGGMDRDSLDPGVRLVVVVIACRVEKGEPEYHPAGFTTSLAGATPISFLEQVEPAAFRERGGAKLRVNVSIDKDEMDASIDAAWTRFNEMQAATRAAARPSYPDDFEVRPIQRKPAASIPTHRTPAASIDAACAQPGVCVGGFSYPDGALPIAATESTGAPISRL